MILTLVILLVTTILFVHGKIRSDLVALCSLLSLVLFGILDPSEAFAGFSSSILIMMIGLFVVGGGVFQTGLAKMISNRMLKLAGTNQTKLFIIVMLGTAGIGAFVSNTGTVALMMPIVVSMAAGANVSPSRFLMPLAFASSMGGMLTLIGTPPNLAIQEVLINAGEQPLNFFSFTPVGLVAIAIGVIFLLPLSKWFLNKDNGQARKKGGSNKSSGELVAEYQLAKNLFRVRAVAGAAICGQTLQQLGITGRYNISVLEVRRRNQQKRFFKAISQEFPGPQTLIQENDILYILGAFDNVKAFVAAEGLEFMDVHATEETNVQVSERLKFETIGIVEVLLMPNSSLINLTVQDAAFRDKYGVNILGIKRKGEYILNNLKYEKMRSGDALLVQGTWANIARLDGDQTEYVIVGQPLAEAAKLPRTEKAPVAAAIMILMVAAMVSNVVAPVIAVSLAAVLMVFTGCLRNAEEAYKTINWESIVLIGAMLPMSVALEKTGASALMADTLVKQLGDYGPYALLAGVYLCTSFLTLFISNTATAVLLAPIALSAARAIEVSPYPFLFAVTVAASMCFASPFSTPPNALVMSAGRYTFMDYVKVGGPLQIIFAIVMIIVLPLLFPF